MKDKLKKKRGSFIKVLSKALLVVVGSGIFFTPIQAVAHNSYFLGITLDKNKYKYEGTVGFDDNDVVANNHKEAQIADFSHSNIKSDAFTLPYPTLSDDGDKNEDKYSKDSNVRSGDGDHGMIYTFPAIHDRTSPWDAGSEDMDRAYWVSTNLIGGYNEALGFIMDKIAFNRNDNSSLNNFMTLAVDVANTANTAITDGSATLSKDNVSFTFERGIKNPINGIKSDYCVTISSGEDYVQVPYKVPKGYWTGQELNSTVPEKMRKELLGEGGFNQDDADIEFLTWKHVTLQAHYNYEVKNISFNSVTNIMKPGKLEQMLSELLANLVGTLRGYLGLSSLQELMLNQGSRNGSYLYGLMPKEWFKSSQLLHWVSQMIAWSLLIGALVKLLVQRNLASINTAMRVNLMEGIQNILLTGFLLSLIIPIFHALGSINIKIVNVFGESSMWIQAFGDTTTGSSGLLAVVVMNIVYFVIMLYFNFVYIMRAITVALLYGTAPLFVVSIAFGGKYKQLFGNWLKELISNIFMQSFHAISLAFFSSASYSGTRGIEGLVLLYAFVPMTQFFRQSLMGLSGGTAEKLGGQALGAGFSVVAGFAGGASLSSKTNTASKNKQTATTGGIQTKSSDALRQKANAPSGTGSSSLSVKGGGAGNSEIGKVSSFGDANDKIPNAELTKFGKGIETLNDWKKNTKSGKAVSGIGSTLVTTAKVGAKVGGTVGKVGGKILQASAGAGMIVGGSAIGNQQIASKGSQNLMKGMSSTLSSSKGAYNSGKEGISNISGKVHDKFMYKSPASNEGLMYATDNDNGTIDYKHETEGLRQGAGISQISDTGKYLQYELDATYKDGKGVMFNTDKLNQGEQYDNLSTMVESYAKGDKEAINYYQKQGIQDVGVNQNTGKIVVTRSKANSGINSVSKSGKHYVINKDNTSHFSNKEVYNVPKYIPKPTSAPQSTTANANPKTKTHY